MLVETAFISNREDERKLPSRRIAPSSRNAIFAGIEQYFQGNAPDGTRLAAAPRAALAARSRAAQDQTEYPEKVPDPASAQVHCSGWLTSAGPCRSASSTITSSTRSPPARSSNGRLPSSRNWSRTASMPARSSIEVEIEAGGVRLTRVRDDGCGIPADGTARSRCRGMPPARSPAPMILPRSPRWGFAAKRCRPSRRCRASRSRRGTWMRNAPPALSVDGGAFGELAPGRASAGHDHRSARPVLQPAGAPQVPAQRGDGAGPHRAAARTAGAVA